MTTPQVVGPLRAHVHRRAIEREDAALHGGIHPTTGLRRVGGRHPRGGQGLLQRLGRHALHHPLAHARRLEGARGRVPLVVGIERRPAYRPAPHRLGAQRHRAQHEQRAPVVADDVDGPGLARQLAEQPVHVGFLGRVEALGRRAAESRQRQRDDVLPGETREESGPDAVRVGDSVDENGGHPGRHPRDARPASQARALRAGGVFGVVEIDGVVLRGRSRSLRARGPAATPPPRRDRSASGRPWC